MKKIYTLSKVLLLCAWMILLYNCEDDHFARYEDPPWLGGSIIETLEKKGNYTILLELMKKAEYEEPINKGLFTLFAANDSAYQAYFKSQGIASVDDISEEKAFQLFALNVLNTPRARQQLVFEYSQWHGGWQKPRSELGALLFRIPTRSMSNDYSDYVKYYKAFKDQTLRIEGQEKMVPLFSEEFFSDFNCAPDGSDYMFFYPESKWTGLQWYNASVDSIGKCSNGYLYYLDRAVPEIPSIEDYLKENQDKFGLYYDLLQRFALYTFSKYDTDPDRTRLYSKSYNRISNIASEIGPTSDGLYRRKVTFSLFLPTDDVLQQFLDNTFLKHFESLDSVPEISLVFLAQSCINNSLDIPSKIEKNFVNFYGDKIPIDVYNDVNKAVFLSNGPVYEMKKYNPPRAFTSTIGPVFFDKKYTTFLYGIEKAKMTLSLTSADLDVT
nr:hypothetical protein [Prolixibacteraceae bacterium]